MQPWCCPWRWLTCVGIWMHNDAQCIHSPRALVADMLYSFLLHMSAFSWLHVFPWQDSPTWYSICFRVWRVSLLHAGWKNINLWARVCLTGGQAYRCAAAADRTGHAILHTLYGMALCQCWKGMTHRNWLIQHVKIDDVYARVLCPSLFLTHTRIYSYVYSFTANVYTI